MFIPWRFTRLFGAVFGETQPSDSLESYPPQDLLPRCLDCLCERPMMVYHNVYQRLDWQKVSETASPKPDKTENHLAASWGFVIFLVFSSSWPQKRPINKNAEILSAKVVVKLKTARLGLKWWMDDKGFVTSSISVLVGSNERTQTSPSLSFTWRTLNSRESGVLVMQSQSLSLSLSRRCFWSSFFPRLTEGERLWVFSLKRVWLKAWTETPGRRFRLQTSEWKRPNDDKEKWPAIRSKMEEKLDELNKTSIHHPSSRGLIAGCSPSSTELNVWFWSQSIILPPPCWTEGLMFWFWASC